MKRVIVLNFVVLILIFLTAGMNARQVPDSVSIEALLKDRINILNYYYGGKMAFEDARNNIEKITADSLLKEDVTMMKAYDGVSFDQVAEYDIRLLSCERTSYGIIKGQVDIFWLMQGEHGRWETEESYFFTAEDDRGKIKLTQLKKL